MPRKAFLKKKSLLDRFKDDYATHTGYIQSARAKHTWNNPLTRRKRTKELNKWIKSFAGKDHIHKLARFNAQQAGKNEDASSNLYIAYHISPTKFEKFRLMPKSGMGTTFYGRGIYLTYDKSVIDYYKNLLADYYDNLYIYTVIISPKAKIISEDEIFDYIDDSVDLEDSEQVANLLKNKVDGIRYYNDEDGNSVVIFNDDLVSIKSRQDCSMKNEAMSLKGFLENLTEKLTKQFDLDLEEVQAYLNSHTQEMQELLDDKELSLKEKVLFVRSEITGEKDEDKKSESVPESDYIQEFRSWLDAQEGEPYNEQEITDFGWEWKSQDVGYPNGNKTYYDYFSIEDDGVTYRLEVAWNSFNETIVGNKIWQDSSEAKKSERLFNKREMERIALSEGSKVSPYLVEIAHKILKDEYGWKASTLEEVADWLGDHKQAFEHAYGQALRSSDDDKANVKAGIEAALDEEEQGVMNAEIAMMGESKKQTNEMIGNKKWVIRIKRLGKNYYVCSSSFRVNKAFRYPSLGGPFVCSDWDITERDIAKYDNYNDAKKAWDGMAQVIRGGLPFYKEGEDYEIVQVNFSMMGESKKHEGYGGTKSVMSIWGNRPRDVYPEVSYSSVNDMYNTLLKYGYGEKHPIYYKNNSPEQIKGHILGYFKWTPTNSDADIEADALAAATMIKNNFDKSESKEPADEKLGYEKGHKNSRGENAPWVIRSHEDNRILASFSNKKDAEEHLKRMKQYSKTESRNSEDLETYACFIDFETEADAQKGMEIVKGWHPVRDDTAVVVDGLGEDAANRLWNDWKRKCAKAGLAISDEGEVYKEEPACFYGNESKQSESDEDFWDAIRKNPVAQELLDEYDRVVNQVIAEVDKTDPDGPWQDEFDSEVYSTENAKAWAGHFLSLYGKDALKEWKYCWEPYNEPVFKEGDKLLTSALKDVPESKQTEASDLSGYTSDVISELDVVWACGENGAKRLADKYADVIQQNYTDGDLLASETAKFIAGQEHLDESRKKKQESKQSEVHLELFDTIIVPKWLWEAHTFGNEYGEDLDEHEQEILSKFESEYGKQYYLDDRSEEADFRSRNDFDEYGGPCYEVDVYKMS